MDTNETGFLVEDVESTDGFLEEKEEDRDEVQEIQRQARGDNSRVCLGRSLATGALLATAVAVTWSTFVVLKEEEKNDFETAVSTALSV